MSKELGLISVDFEDFVNEVLPRTVDGHYKGSTPEEQYEDFRKKEPDTKALFVKKHGVGERICVRIYNE